MSDAIGPLRNAIDALDDELLALLGRRADLARRIGALKQGAPAYRPERESEILRRVTARNPGPLPDERVAAVFREVMSACRSLEAAIRVAYLGPEGTFSEMALRKQFGHAVEAEACASIDDVFRAAESGGAQFAVVPVENSTEGAVGRTLDLLLRTSLKICGEVALRVHQHLLRRNDQGGAALEGVRRVYSHPQSLAQCHLWLGAHLPRAVRIPAASNGEAARLAADEAGACAIGPEIAAERYGLAVMASNIEDDPNNRTRFLVLGAQAPAPTGRDATSLVMSAPNRPGAVHALLTPLARHGVSMTRIESRPTRVGQWEYYFFVDLEGHRSDPPVAAALAELEQLAPLLKVLGSYPVAVA
ncbi:MAG: prephenate dehydratase [Betaproteobacteria bacterium]|nr:MAG: prephenate dehydratase [Betaproteobacteria bacterium]